MSATQEPTVDGRTARRDRNRELVLDAVIELFAEHLLLPTAPQVAERSGVSPRSVFRYYEDTEALIQAAMRRHMDRVTPLFEMADMGVGDFDDRSKRFIAAHLRLYDAIAPTARAALIRAPSNAAIAARLDAARHERRSRLEAMFAPELSGISAARRRILLAAVDAVFQFEGLEHLHRHLGLTRRQVTEVLRHTLAVHLQPS